MHPLPPIRETDDAVDLTTTISPTDGPNPGHISGAEKHREGTAPLTRGDPLSHPDTGIE